MAQIAGYALGGCWTHIRCVQSVVAHAFLVKDVDSTLTPMRWIRAMTGILRSLFVMLTVAFCLRAWMLP